MRSAAGSAAFGWGYWVCPRSCCRAVLVPQILRSRHSLILARETFAAKLRPLAFLWLVADEELTISITEDDASPGKRSDSPHDRAETENGSGKPPLSLESWLVLEKS